MPAAFVLLRCIGKAVVKNVVNLFTFGVGGDILVDAWDYWQEASRDEQRAADVQALASAPAAEVAAAAAEVVRQEGAGLSDAEKQAVMDYLQQVPPMIRRSQRRPADPDGKSVRPGTTFRRPDDLLPLLPPQAPRFKPGDRPLPGVDWELVELLGRGGFGEVWKAKNPHFDGVDPVALKFCLDPAAKQRLLRHEAAVLNQVMREGRHDGIVRLQHTYLNADPPCLAYEYVAGGDLAGWIQDTAQSGGMAPAPAARVVQRLAAIIGFAHGLTPPIVHRDLKPANILVQVRPGGKALLKIGDFGIGGLAMKQAREASRRPTAAAFFTSAVLGSYTLLYASPQQMRGDEPHPSDDVYSLGVIWYQLLTGDVTKGCPTGRGWQKRLTDRGMSPALVDLLIDCFGDEREERPVSGADLAERLTALLGEAAPPASPTPSSPAKAPVPAEDDLATIYQRSIQAVNAAHAEARRKAEQDHDYAAAVEILEAVPEHLRDAKLLENARQWRDRAALLDKTVRDKVQATRTDGLREDVTELLQYWPHRADLRRLLESLPKAPEKQIVNSLGMKLALIPAGSFLMGSPADEVKRSDDEGPQHEVTITRPFYLGVYPVTVGEFHAFAQAAGYKTEAEKEGTGAYAWNGKEWKQDPKFNWQNPGWKLAESDPVTCVSWNDAVAFCQWLAKKEGRAYRLPTEAEWEYACRAGTTTPFHFGASASSRQLNCDGNFPYEGSSKCLYLQRTSKVGSYPANAWGLHDMHGNVWEWCADWYDKDHYQSSDKIDPQGVKSGAARVFRGGSWDNNAENCRSACRNGSAPGSRSGHCGLRV